MSLESWEKASEEEVTEYGIFRIRRYLARSPRTGQTRPFAIIDTAEWVNVVAVTPSSEVVLVRQYRHGTDHITLEIPGGIVDPQEDPAIAAARELREETGFEGGAPVFLGTVEPNPALLTNRQHTYFIPNAERRAVTDLDPGEDIEVTKMPLAEVPRAISDGRVRHALVICAFWWLREKRPGGIYF